VRPSKALSAAAQSKLADAGVKESPFAVSPPTQALSWIELLRAKRAADPAPDLQTVLFLVPGEGRSLLALCGEMLRLGCDRQEFRMLQRGGEVIALLRASGPPYYTLTNALDHVDGLRAFVPSPPSRRWAARFRPQPSRAGARLDRARLRAPAGLERPAGGGNDGADPRRRALAHAR
jgi:cellulose synthase operon protein C